MSKRNTLNIGGNIDSKNMLLRLSGKNDEKDNKSILLKYAGKSKDVTEVADEGTDEGVSINNIKNIPIQRKQRHNLRDIETVTKETSAKKNNDYDSLTIMPAVKYQGVPKEE
jgi:hypothetical protein